MGVIYSILNFIISSNFAHWRWWRIFSLTFLRRAWWSSSDWRGLLGQRGHWFWSFLDNSWRLLDLKILWKLSIVLRNRWWLFLYLLKWKLIMIHLFVLGLIMPISLNGLGNICDLLLSSCYLYDLRNMHKLFHGLTFNNQRLLHSLSSYFYDFFRYLNYFSLWRYFLFRSFRLSLFSVDLFWFLNLFYLIFLFLFGSK